MIWLRHDSALRTDMYWGNCGPRTEPWSLLPGLRNPLRHLQLDIAAWLGQNRRFVFDPKFESGELIE